MEVSGQLYAMAAYLPGKNPRRLSDPTTFLNVLMKRKIPALRDSNPGSTSG
jgi:hypothetical protein